MNPTTLRRLDQLSLILLLLWAGAALGFGIFSAPVFFRELPSRDVAGRIAGRVAILGATGSIGRWVAEVKEDLIGPIRLWSGGLMVALLMCLASSFIVTPKVQAIRARINAPIESLAPDSADRVAYNKAHGLSRNLFFLRILLAVGLAATVGLLPGPGRKDGPAEG